jgi:hypothetical protein
MLRWIVRRLAVGSIAWLGDPHVTSKPENCPEDGNKWLEKAPDRDWWNRAYRHDANESWDKSEAIEATGVQRSDVMQHNRGKTYPQDKPEDSASKSCGSVNGQRKSTAHKKESCGEHYGQQQHDQDGSDVHAPNEK